MDALLSPGPGRWLSYTLDRRASSFFGGPGNSYSAHGMVALVRGDCARWQQAGMISANGGVDQQGTVALYAAQAGRWRLGPRPDRGTGPHSEARILSKSDHISSTAGGDQKLCLPYGRPAAVRPVLGCKTRQAAAIGILPGCAGNTTCNRSCCGCSRLATKAQIAKLSG